MSPVTALQALAAVLPPKAQKYAKALYGSLFVVLTVVSASIPEVPLWVTVVLGVLTGLATLAIPAPGYDGGPAGKHAAD